MRCDSCVYWSAFKSYDDNQLLGVQKCEKAIELWEATTWNDDGDRVPKGEHADQMMFVMDGSSYMANLYTKADFYCAHFKQK